MSTNSFGLSDGAQWKSSDINYTSSPRHHRDASIAQYESCPVTLEVMHGKEMSRLLQSSATAAGAAVCLTLIAVLIARFHSVGKTGSSPVAPTYLLILEIIGSSLLFVMMVAIGAHFGARILRLFPGHRTKYQLLTTLLIASTCVALFPTRALADLVTGNETPSKSVLLVDEFRDTIASSVTFLYIWLTLRFCREPHAFDDQEKDKSINVGNVVIIISLSLYVLLRVVTAHLFAISHAALPLQSFISFLGIVSARPSKQIAVEQVVSLCLLTVTEIVFIILISRSNRKTETFMSCADLNEYRSENIMHRFFKMSTGFFLVPVFLIAVTQFGYPTQQSVDIFTSDGLLLLSPPVGGLAVGLLLFFFASRQAYVNLPSDSDGLADWMKDKTSSAGPGQKPRGQANELANEFSSGELSVNGAPKALRYRATDERDPDRGHPLSDPRSFSLESAVLLFNFSWLVYTYGTVGFSPAKPDDFGKPDYQVAKHIKNVERDVHVLVVDGPDRIIVTFKGSNSVANATTDKDSKKTNAVHAFKGENSPAAKALPGIHLNVDASTWRGCKVHRGYASAFAAVRVELFEEISRLFRAKSRPIFVCGHSSGGALATLCSFELGTIELLPASDQICVYSFGSPRVGNTKFANVYDHLVQNHWRCVVAGDSTTSIPLEAGFTHVGNMAMFTRNGQLTLEKLVRLRWWQSEKSSHPMYKLTAYYCALSTWAQSYCGQTASEIGLWNWPIDKATSYLFSPKYSPPNRRSSGIGNSSKTDIETPGFPVAESPSKARAVVEPESLDDVVAFSK